MLDEIRKRRIKKELGNVDELISRMNNTSDYREKIDIACELLNRLYKLLR